MGKLSIKATTALLESPAFVDGLTIRFGSRAAVARELGISSARLGRMRERFYEPSDRMILAMQKGLGKLSRSEMASVKSFAKIGDKFTPWQIKNLQRRARRDPEFRKNFGKEIVRQEKKFLVDFPALAGSPKSKGKK